jgi:hypothetical protein
VFAKVFRQIFESSIAEDYNCRRMFMDLLVLADSDGVVDMTTEAIARATNVPIEEVIRYLKELQQSDPRSRSKRAGGARIKPLDSRRDWGWKIVNHAHYRELRDEEGRRAYFRNYMRGKRARERREISQSKGKSKQPLTSVKKLSLTVNTCQPQLTNADAEADAVQKDKATALSCTQTKPMVWSRAAGFEEITSELHQKWRIAYPALNIDRQLAAMDQWLRNNPKKAVKKNWGRFVTNWLERKQERGGDMPSFRSPKIFDPSQREREDRIDREMEAARKSLAEKRSQRESGR